MSVFTVRVQWLLSVNILWHLNLSSLSFRLHHWCIWFVSVNFLEQLKIKILRTSDSWVLRRIFHLKDQLFSFQAFVAILLLKIRIEISFLSLISLGYIWASRVCNYPVKGFKPLITFFLRVEVNRGANQFTLRFACWFSCSLFTSY